MKRLELFENYFDITGQHRINTPFTIPLGITDNGEFETLAIPHLPRNHILITGLPGTGKSTFLRVILNAIFLTQSPKQAQIWLHDCTGYELKRYATPHISHFNAGDTVSSCHAFLQSLEEEYERRKAYLIEKQETSFNHCLRKYGTNCIPRAFVIIDYFDHFLRCCNNGGRHMIERLNDLLQTACAFGVTFIVTAQGSMRTWEMSDLTNWQFSVRIGFPQSEKTMRELLENANITELANSLAIGEALVNLPTIHKVKTLYISPEAEEKIAEFLSKQHIDATQIPYKEMCENEQQASCASLPD